MLDVRKTVDYIAESMIAGTPPWRKPWLGFPTNPWSSQRYSGMNAVLLDAVSFQRLYPSKFWATYRQWDWLGCRIRERLRTRPDTIPKGEWGTKINQANGKSVWVFNATQVFGPDAGIWNIIPEIDPNYDYVDKIIEATQAVWRWGTSEHPEYRRPPYDDICMPDPEQFEGKCQLCGSQLHELVHWSEWRTGWKGTLEQGELIAEIATGWLENELGIPHCTDMSNHNKYLQCWIEEMSADPKYLVNAVTQATKVVNFILGA